MVTLVDRKLTFYENTWNFWLKKVNSYKFKGGDLCAGKRTVERLLEDFAL